MSKEQGGDFELDALRDASREDQFCAPIRSPMLNVLAKIQQAEAGLVKKFNRLLLLGFAALAIPGIGRTKDPVAVKWSPAVHEYCRVLRFPQGWQMPLFARGKYGGQELIPRFELGDSDYEFRVPGVLGTRSLVCSVEDYGFVKSYTKLVDVLAE